ncbi:MAG: hypothetical protein AAB366_00825 [Patescibacteria group bacterium]
MLFVYLFNRLAFRTKEFFRHWYIKSFFIYSHFVVSLLEKIDRVFAFKITLRHLFKPLYGDYSVLGYILGFIFRLGRLIISGLIYLILIILAVFIYAVWLAIPFYIVYRIIFK